MKFLLKSEIVQMLNTKTRKFTEELDSKNESEYKIIKKLQGPHVLQMNPKIAKLAIGKRIYGLSGQQLLYPESRKDKLKQVEKLKVHGFGTDEDMKPSLTYSDGDSILMTFAGSGGPYQVYECSGVSSGVWGTGSGCDPVYVFAKK